MQPKMIIRCRRVRCGTDMMMDESEIKVAVCNGIENDFFQNNVRWILDANRIQGVLKAYMDAEALLEETQKQDIIFYLLKSSPLGELSRIGELKKKHNDSKIIFVAESGAYMKDAYKAQPFGYLLLSDTREEIQEAIFSAIRDMREKKGIVLEGNKKFYYILLKDILYIEALGDDIGIFTTESYEYIIRIPLKRMNYLLEDEFIRFSRQQIVNARHIQSLKNVGAILDNGEEIAISGRERKNVVKRYMEYIFKMGGTY